MTIELVTILGKGEYKSLNRTHPTKPNKKVGGRLVWYEFRYNWI